MQIIFYKVLISTKYETIILKCVVLSAALARPGTILLVVTEISSNSYKKGTKTYKFIIKSRMYKTYYFIEKPITIQISTYFNIIVTWRVMFNGGFSVTYSHVLEPNSTSVISLLTDYMLFERLYVLL